MQDRHINRNTYFDELSNTSRDYYINYVRKFIPIEEGTRMLEIGCGEGGNLLPFAEIGCQVTGVDRSPTRIVQAKEFFNATPYEGTFLDIDFFELNIPENESDKYDIILIHDVIEHISKKDAFVQHIQHFLKKEGIVFWGFPAWQMPFGGHQQICHHRVCSKLPFIHLLPRWAYRGLLKLFGEKQNCIEELLDIKQCKVSIERFEKLMHNNNYRIVDRYLWFINPHYKEKFKLKPRKLIAPLGSIKYVRNFFTTSCFYITKALN